jgi:sialate O-acetylesterase
MKRFLFATCVAIAATLHAEEKLERGKDRIDTPAIGSGLCVHNLFQSNMVVQRDKPMPIWGWAAAGEKVTVSFAGNTQSATAAADRSWKVELPALPASTEPRTITVQGKDSKIELTNILVGDVWLLGGQSNMEFEIAKLEEGPLEIISANFDQIRLFTVPQQNEPEPKKALPRQYQWSGFFSRHFRQGYWDVCSPETVEEMSGIGYIFAHRIHMATRVPIGLVDVSRGGTSLVTWTPLDVLKQIDTPEVKSTLAE